MAGLSERIASGRHTNRCGRGLPAENAGKEACRHAESEKVTSLRRSDPNNNRRAGEVTGANVAHF